MLHLFVEHSYDEEQNKFRAILFIPKKLLTNLELESQEKHRHQQQQEGQHRQQSQLHHRHQGSH